MITPVIFNAPNQRHLYSRLIQYCKELDETEIVKVEGPEPKVGYPAVCNVAFQRACEAMKGKPFVWLEADSIPTQPGWLKKLDAEWKVAQSFGKSVVWTTDINPPFDLCTGIGVYGPDAHLLVPEGLADDGFDGYILKNHSDKIHKTSLIQHSYGSYNVKGDVTLHRHPKVRGDAVIFHKDQFQDLISVENHWGHSGDLGDIVYAMSLIKDAGGGYVWLFDRPFTKVISSRFDLIAPLLMSQPYIKATSLSSGRDVQYDLSKFRSHYQPDRTLAMSQSLYAMKSYGLPISRGDKPWLTAKKNPATKGRVVLARSPRYHNPASPWRQVLSHYGDACVFIGLKEEHKAFESEFGPVEYLKTDNMLEVAEAIAGSDLFVGNQSSPYAIAEGLKHPRIQEVCDRVPDCIYPNHGVLCYDGHLSELPAAGGKKLVTFDRQAPIKFRKLDTLVCPPKGWRFPDFTTSTHANVLASQVARALNISKQDAMQQVYDYNCQLSPEFFKDTAAEAKYSRVMKAIKNAQ